MYISVSFVSVCSLNANSRRWLQNYIARRNEDDHGVLGNLPFDPLKCAQIWFACMDNPENI